MENMYNIYDWCTRQTILYRQLHKTFVIEKRSDEIIIIFSPKDAYAKIKKKFEHKILSHDFVVTDTEVLMNQFALEEINEKFSQYLKIQM